MSIFIIGEIGINHNGDLSIARELIKRSKEVGADAVKFQKRTIDVVYSKETLDSPRPRHVRRVDKKVSKSWRRKGDRAHS